jgi:microcystin-dependent protein
MNFVRKSAVTLLTGASFACLATPAQAQYRYIGDIFTVGYTFCPRGSFSAEGQLLPISSYSAMFALYGTTYGGNGTTTFQLPDLRSRSPIGQGTGPGLSTFPQGARGGVETITLTTSNLPAHTHTGRMVADKDVQANRASPSGSILGRTPGVDIYVDPAVADDPMATGTIQVDQTGGNLPFNNRNPYLALRFCVVSDGIFPSRN